jgi:hypothetical protein
MLIIDVLAASKRRVLLVKSAAKDGRFVIFAIMDDGNKKRRQAPFLWGDVAITESVLESSR